MQLLPACRICYYSVWKYIRAKLQDTHDIPTLFIDDQPIHSAKGKANALNSHFKSVFTEENLSTIPTIDSHTDVPNMPDIQSGIHHYLQRLMNTRLVDLTECHPIY